MTEEDVSKDLKEKFDQRVAELKDMNEKNLMANSFYSYNFRHHETQQFLN